jgi:integrase
VAFSEALKTVVTVLGTLEFSTMPRLSADSAPKYRKHKASGQAIVTLSGRDHYLGPYGTAASRKAYDRLVAEWIANGRATPARQQDVTVIELLAAYKRFARSYYAGSSEYDNILLSIKPLQDMYVRLPVVEFGPLKLKAVRQRMIDDDLCRNEINKRLGRLKRIFRWGVENEIVPPSIFHGLQAVRGLSRGRSDARESEPVKPVPEAFVDGIKDKLPPQLWAMIELQRYSGMRPGEVCAMRTGDLDTSSKVWTYTPPAHKSAWRGHQRKIYLGPRAQAVLKSWLRTNLDERLFQPREAQAWRREQARKARKTPLSCGNRAGTNVQAKPRKRPGLEYNPRSYHQAIRQACLKADVPLWHPHQLRHNAATWLRKEFGLDVARVVLGHRSPQITEVYAELDHAKAAEVMSKVG